MGIYFFVLTQNCANVNLKNTFVFLRYKHPASVIDSRAYQLQFNSLITNDSFDYDGVTACKTKLDFLCYRKKHGIRNERKRCDRSFSIGKWELHRVGV